MDEIKKLYTALLGKGYTTNDLGDEGTFREKMKDKENRKTLYDWVSRKGNFRLGAYEEYEKRLSPSVELAPAPVTDNMHYVGRINAEPTDMQQMADAQRAQWGEAQRRADARQAAGDVPDYNFLRVERTKLIDAPKLDAPILQYDADRAVDESMQRINGAVAPEYNAFEDARMRALQRQAQTNYDARVKQNAEEAVGDLRSRAAALSDKYEAKDEDIRRDITFAPHTPGGILMQQGWFRGYNQDLISASAIIGDTEKMIADYAARQNMGGPANLVRSFATTAFDPMSYDLGLTDLTVASRLENAVDKLDNGETLTDTEQLLLDAAVNQQVLKTFYGELSGWQLAGKTTGDMIPFAMQIASNPASSIYKYAGTKVAEKVAAHIVKRVSKKVLQNILTKAATAAVNTSGVAASGYGIALTSNIMDTAADVTQRRIGDIGVDYDENGIARYDGRHNIKEAGEALIEGINNKAFEFASEALGAYFAPFLKGLGKVAGKGLSKMGMGAVNRWVGDFVKKGSVKAVGEFFDKTQWHGFVAEYGEEIANGMLNAAFVGDMTMEDVFSKDNLIDTAIGLSVMGVLGGVIGTGGYIVAKHKERAELNKAGAEGQRLLRSKWRDFAGAVERSEDTRSLTDNLRKVMEAYGLRTLPAEDMRAVYDYAVAYNRYKALDAVSARAVEDGVMDAEEIELRDLYNGGRGSLDKAAVRQEYEAAREALAVTLMMPDVLVEQNFRDYGNALRTADIYEDNGDTAAADALRAYVRAKAKHDGMTEYIRDEYGAAVAKADAEIDAVANKKDGNLYEVSLQDGSNAYIVDGVVVVDEQGFIDESKSDELLHVNIGGTVKQVTPDKVAKINNVTSASEAKEARMLDIETAYNNAYDALTAQVVPASESVAAPAVENVAAPAATAAPAVQVDPAEAAARALNVSAEELSQVIPDAQKGEGVAAAMEANGNVDGAKAVRAYVGAVFGNNTPKNIPENGNIGTENIPTAENIPQGEAAQQPRVPLEKRGKEEREAFHLIPIERTIEELYSRDLSQDEIDGFVQANIDEIKSDIEKHSKKQPKMGANIDAYKRAKVEWQLRADDLQVRLDYYYKLQQGIAEITSSYANEMINDPVDNVKDIVTADEFIASLLGGNGIRITPESFQKETGLKGEQKSLVGVIASKEKGGVNIERASEIIYENYGDELRQMGFTGDETDIRNAIITILYEGHPAGYAKRGAEMRQQQVIEERKAQMEALATNLGFESLDDYIAYEESFLPRMIEKYAGFDEQEYYNEFKNYDRTRESERVSGGSEVLQGEQPVIAAGTVSVGKGQQGGAIRSDVQGSVENEETQGDKQVAAQSDGYNVSSAEQTVRLSDEVDENGKQFVLNSNGEIVFGEITDDTGLTPAPILLSEGMITNPATNDGYGLVHIEARHGEQIRKAGYKSVVEFVEEVAKNYEVIREGKDRDGHQTYMLQLTDKHNNTLMVELSGDGTYWNINTAGIFKTSYGKNRKEVYSRHTTAKQSTETAEASQDAEQGGTRATSSINAPTTSSASEDTTPTADVQENKQKSGENTQNGGEKDVIEETREQERIAKEREERAGVPPRPSDYSDAISRGNAEAMKAWEEKFNEYAQKLNSDDLPAIEVAIRDMQGLKETIKAGNPKGYKENTNYKAFDYIEKALKKRKKEIEQSSTNGKKQKVVEDSSTEQVTGKLPASEQTENAAPKKKRRKSPTTPQELAQAVAAQAEENRRRPLRERAQEWQEKLGVQVNVIESVDEVKNSAALRAINEGDKVTGWFSGGKVYVYMPGIENMAELDRTVVHEVVAHKGLKSLMGDKFDALCDKVWESMDKEARAKYLGYVNVRDINAPSVAEMRAAADEYMAFLAEGVDLTDADRTVWQKVVEFFREFVEKLGVKMSDKDIELLIKASYANLRNKADESKANEQAEDGETRERKVFHGSGAKFDKFDHSFMGTGEGNQAFGWGTYVTEVEGIGRLYADPRDPKFSRLNAKLGNIYDALRFVDLNVERAKRELEQTDNETAKERAKYIIENAENSRKALYKEKDAVEKEMMSFGRYLYTVEIPDDSGSNYLHWEEVVPSNVVNAVKQRLFDELAKGDYKGAEKELKRELDDVFKPSNSIGSLIYGSIFSYLGSDKAASEFLNDMGFVGISYPADGGRAGNKRNYVIFNENDAQIENRTMFRVSRTPQEFDAAQAEAVEKRGIVAPGLNEAVVNVVDVPRHDFTGNLKEARAKAKEWAIENYTGKEFDLPENAGKYVISKNAIGKYLDKSAFDKSENAAVHLSVLKELPNVISNSIEAEIHADYSKGVNGERSAENGVNRNDLLVHRIYGAVNIDGKTYRVKTTIHEFRDANTANTPHSYEVTKIELIEDSTVTPNDGIDNPLNRSVNSISATKLLEGVEKSYDKGKKVLVESENSSENPQDSEEDTRLRIANRSQEVFVSNARKAVEEIKQEKATPQQWLAMLKKNGGLKAGEDAWIGLSEWLENSESKSLTKQELLDFIDENAIKIEEVEYRDDASDNYAGTTGFLRAVEEQLEEDARYHAESEVYPDEFDNEEDYLYAIRSAIREYKEDPTGVHYNIAAEKVVRRGDGPNLINSTRLDYTTEGLENKREIALVVPTIEPYNASDEIHFGDAGGGRAVAWVRFGETTDSEGKRVLVIDEIQSKRHQDSREKGYKSITKKEYDATVDALEKAQKTFDSYNEEMAAKYGTTIEDWPAVATDEEIDTYQKLYDNVIKASNVFEDASANYYGGVPSAPFDKNWHELAMKRMLRLAAEEGFDKVAWTTGEQQAQRYNLGNVIKKISVFPDSEFGGRQVMLRERNNDIIDLDVDNNGVIENGQFKGMQLSEVVGRELAVKILGATTNEEYEYDDLRIGGEGMKGFYDRMLPSFIQKYTKKWGAKVGEVTMPNLEQNNTMWSVNITPEMQESVMEGQTMFRFIGERGAANIDAAEETTTRLDNLAIAREMEAKGKEAKAIKLATGWERGADGRWRYETEDIVINKNAVFHDVVTGKELAFDENGYMQKDGVVKLGDFVEDKELFEAYPELRDYTVSFNAGTKYLGLYKGTTITINRGRIGLEKNEDGHSIRSILVHEIQHAIQSIEGFARGGNKSMNNPVLAAEVEKSEQLLRSSLAKEYKERDELLGQRDKLEEKISEWNKQHPDGVRDEEIDSYNRQYKNLDERINELNESISTDETDLFELSFIDVRIGKEGYRRLAGEVESRNVQERLDYSPEQRRNKLARESAEFEPEEQIFIYEDEATNESAETQNYTAEEQKIIDREGDGAYTDDEVSFENDPISKVLGKPRGTRKQRREFAQRERRRMVERVESLAKKLHLDNVEIVTDASTLEGKKQRAKGFYTKSTGKITIVIPNHSSTFDVEQTLLHEAVAHYGLRQLFGEHFDTFLDNVFNNADEAIRQRIVALAAKNGWDFHKATEEYLAMLAEDTEFENTNASWWRQIKDFFLNMLHKIGFEDFRGVTLTDNELRYILWRSYENLAEPGKYRSILGEAADVAKQYELGVGNYAATNTSTENNDIRFRNVQSNIGDEYMAAVENGDRETAQRLEREVAAQAERVDSEIVSAVNAAAQGLDTGVEIVSDIADVPDARRRGSKGWYENGKVYLVLPNAEGVEDAVETVLHEVVGHKGLRRLFGEKFDDMLADVFKSAPKNVRAEIMRRALELMRRGRKNFLHEATEEYLAEQAERGFEDYSVWDTVKALFHKLLRSIGVRHDISDEEIRYMLWRSYKLMKNGKSFMGELENVNKQEEFGVGEYRMRMRMPLRSEGRGVTAADGVVELRDAYDATIESSLYQAREALQDSMRSLKVFQNFIEKATGKEIPDWMNAYYLENAMSSANKAEAELFARVHYQKIIQALTELNKGGLKFEEIYDYMMAKHGIERNREMSVREALTGKKGLNRGAYEDWTRRKKEIWAKKLGWEDEQKELDDLARMYGAKEKDYSGLTGMYGLDYRAKAYGAVKAVEGKRGVGELWEAINDATAAILKKQYDTNMMSLEVKNEIEGMYKYYIPLRGFDEKTAGEVYAYLNNSRSPMAKNVKAEGRTSKAENPVAWIAAMAESAIVRGNRNRMKNAFFNLVAMNPNDLVSIDSNVYLEYKNGAWKVATPDIPAKATQEQVQQTMAAFEQEMEDKCANFPDLFKRLKDNPDIPYVITETSDMMEHQVYVRRNGKLFVMTVNGNPRLAQAVNGYTNPDSELKGAIPVIVEGGKVINRWLSSVYTTRNLDFVVSNFIRDMFYSNTMAWVKESPEYARKFNVNYAVSVARIMGLIWKYDRGELDMGKKIEKMFYDFMINGGETGYTNLKQMEQRKKKLLKDLKKKGQKSAVEYVGMYFDEINRSVENATRFAAFMTSREMGRTMARSIWDAKEISVNFNKKGAGDKMFGATGQTGLGNAAAIVAGLGVANYTFWNAGVQGLNNFATTVAKNPYKGAALIAVLTAMGAAAALFNYYDDDDEEDSYWMLPSYIRRNNFVFRVTGMKDWITLPLPVEYRAIYGMSNYLAGVIVGKEEFDALEFAGLVSQVLPLDMLADGGGLNALVPTWAKPLWQNYTNTNWMGTPIAKKNEFNELDPEYKRVYGNVSAASVELSKFLHVLGGGNTQTRAENDLLFEWNPAMLENLASGYLGGYASMAEKAMKTVEWIAGAREYDNSYILLVNRVLKSSNVNNAARSVKDRYYENLGEIERWEHSMNGWKRDMVDPAKSEEERNEARTEYEKMMRSDDASTYYELKAVRKAVDLFRDLNKVHGNDAFKSKELEMMREYNRIFKERSK